MNNVDIGTNIGVGNSVAINGSDISARKCATVGANNCVEQTILLRFVWFIGEKAV